MLQSQLFLAEDYWEAGTQPAPWVRVPHSAKEAEVLEQGLIQSLKRAPWKFIDVETTGLTPGSEPLEVTARNRKAGDDPTLRLRVVSALWPDGDQLRVESFDLDAFDQHSLAWREKICSAALSETLIAHNAGFDTFWLRQHSSVKPKRVLDTMLIARILAPRLPRRLIRIAAEGQPEDPLVSALLKTAYAEKSGWSLADVTAVLVGVVMPKELQLPQNWVGFALSNAHYTYAVDDVIRAYQVMAILLGLHPDGDSSLPGVLPILEAYDKACKQHPEMLRQEPQVWDLIPIRERGMPIDFAQINRFVDLQKAEVARQAKVMAEEEPELKPFEADLADWSKGVSASLKKTLGKAFMKRGLDLNVTAAKGDYQIGEKALRLVGAQNLPEAQALYTAWIALNKAKKTGNMAEDVGAFARRSPDLRVHPLLGHGPATGRLSCAEPNAQQFPSLPEFRAIVAVVKQMLESPGQVAASEEAPLICAVDYSALDMRVGAALAVRAQREIAEAVITGCYYGLPVEPKVLALLRKIHQLRKLDDQQQAKASHTSAQPWSLGLPESPLRTYKKSVFKKFQELEAQFQEHRLLRDSIESSERTKYWETYRTLQKRVTLGRFAYRLTEVLINAQENGEAEWSALRDTFRMGIDVHTSTTLRMEGVDPKSIFGGLTGENLEKKQKQVKHDLDNKRKGGKVANLGLLYYMQTHGFKDYAASLFNIHWSLAETEVIRHNWLNSYPEVDLWAVWTSLNPIEMVEVPDKTRRSRLRTEALYRAETLGGRVMYPLGLNAALAYGDQGTGADILGEVVHELATLHPRLYACAINQVHDEMVFELPAATAEQDSIELGRIMDECADRFLMPYGVPSACTPALGSVWLKD